MKNSALFSSTTDRWATPASVYAALDSEFHFNCYPCPLDGTEDALLPLFYHGKGKRVFCNPPYGNALDKWLLRGLEAELAVYLLPARVETKWFRGLCLPLASEIRFVRGRLKFGSAKNCAPFPSIIVIFRRMEK
jgi:hypothetical protein